jgi:phospholipid/cholesterol/gamma-HCH transport system substrate-binding protein
MTVALVVLAVLVVAVLLFGSGGSYRLTLQIDNASQLVKGNQVKVGGVPVGSVSNLELGPDSRAEIEITIKDPELEPLHEGTTAEVRSTSLAGVANRYVALKPGPVNGAEIPSGGEIPADDVTAQVDLDQLLNTLDSETQRDLKTLVGGGAQALRGRGRRLGRAVEVLNPALSQIQTLERELLRDQGRFARFLVESADVVSAVASREPELVKLVSSGRATLDEIAARDSELDSLLGRLPDTLRTTNTGLVNTRAALADLRPTVRLARPVARPLADTLRLLRPVARDARPVVAQLRETVDRRGGRDLIGVLTTLPALERAATPALRSTVATVNDALPIVTELRPYTPDVVGGLMNGFGGTTGSYYDANGHYARISFQSNAYSLTGLGSLVPAPSGTPGLTGYRKGLVARCPGAATQPAPDRSNPWVVPGCDPGDSP